VCSSQVFHSYSGRAELAASKNRAERKKVYLSIFIKFLHFPEDSQAHFFFYKFEIFMHSNDFICGDCISYSYCFNRMTVTQGVVWYFGG